MSYKTQQLISVVKIIHETVKPFDGEKYYMATGDLSNEDTKELELVSYKNRPSRADLTSKTGDLILARMKSTNKVLNVQETESDYIYSTGFIVLRPTKVVDNNFLLHYLQSPLFQDEKDKLCTGATQKAINNQNFANIEIPLPPLPIQKRIAEILDTADALRRKDQELLRKYDELAQSIFVDMFGDPVKNEKGWEVIRLGDLFFEPAKCGPFGSALKKEEYIKNGIPVWVMDNIQNYDFNEDGCLFINEEKYDDLRSYSAKNGDIIVSRAGTVGKMSVINSKYTKSIISTNLIKISLDESRISPYYFIKLMEYFGKKIGRLRTGSENGFTHMNTGVLAGLTFSLPPIEKQLRFIEILSNIKNQSKVLIEQPEQLFNSLLQQAFKGELVK